MENQNKNLDTNGGYQNEDVIWHQHSNKLMLKILEYFSKGIPVIDLGCGHNWYCGVLEHFGYDAQGVDSVKLKGVDIIADITNPLIVRRFMNVISLEVGEHIPNNLSSNYLDNLTSFKGDIIMSWAIEGQDGIGHINCRNNDWVIEQMKLRNYKLDEVKTLSMREAVADCNCSWFRNTLMYFTPCA